MFGRNRIASRNLNGNPLRSVNIMSGANKATLGSLKGSPQFQSNNDLKSFVNVKNPYGDDLLR